MIFYSRHVHTFWTIVRIILTWKILVIKPTNSTEVNGNLPHPSIISRILNEYVEPMMRSLPADSPLFRSLKETAVEKAIKERIYELREFLQDNDVNGFYKDNFMLEGNDETAIIEFLPKTQQRSEKNNTIKNDLKKYKKIRQKIKKTLTKESVSEKTKSLVLKTLDDLVKTLIEGQCDWKRPRAENENQEPHIIANKWNEGWQSIKNLIMSFLSTNSRKTSDVPKYIDHIHMLLQKVSKDADFISKKYKIQCEFVPKVSYLTTENNALRINWDKTDLEEDRCQKVVVCSNELRDYMLRFHHSLNDTTVSALRNYVEMYIREASVDEASERELIVAILANTSNEFETTMEEIYVKEVKKFKLNKNKQQEGNINAISNFVKNNIKNVKDRIRKTLKTKLLHLREKSVSVIRDDIDVNLDVDLGNLEQEFLKRICTAFRLCNGKYAGRRQSGLLETDKNNILVQMQLSFDDLPEYRRMLDAGFDKNNTTTVMQYVSSANVTRTTISN